MAGSLPATWSSLSFVGSVDRQFLVHVVNVEDVVLEKARSKERLLAIVGDYLERDQFSKPIEFGVRRTSRSIRARL